MLHKIDVIPLQVLIEATIAEVDLNDQLQYGTQFFFKTDHVAETLGPSNLSSSTCPPIPAISGLSYPSMSPYFILSKAPQFALAALADVTKVKVLSAPEIMVLDNQPARLQVGQQVPVLTGHRDQHARGGRADRQQHRLSLNRGHHAGDPAGQFRWAGLARYRPGSQSTSRRRRPIRSAARRHSTIRFFAPGLRFRTDRRSGMAGLITRQCIAGQHRSSISQGHPAYRDSVLDPGQIAHAHRTAGADHAACHS